MEVLCHPSQAPEQNHEDNRDIYGLRNELQRKHMYVWLCIIGVELEQEGNMLWKHGQ